jgi:hypothetical protein
MTDYRREVSLEIELPERNVTESELPEAYMSDTIALSIFIIHQSVP